MGLPEGKLWQLIQYRLNIIQIIKFYLNSKKILRVLGVTLRGLPYETKVLGLGKLFIDSLHNNTM